MPISRIAANRMPAIHARGPKITQALCDKLNAKLFPKPGAVHPPPFKDRPPKVVESLFGGFEVDAKKNAFILNLTIDADWSPRSLEKKQKEVEEATGRYVRSQFSKDSELQPFAGARFDFYWGRPPFV
jgi:hypothetical protein